MGGEGKTTKIKAPKCAEVMPKRELKPISEAEKKEIRRKEALLLGTFSAPSYIDVYDGKTPVPYGFRAPDRSNFRDLPPIKKGEEDIKPEQWEKTNPGKLGKTPDVLFQHGLHLEELKRRGKDDSDRDKDAWKKEYVKTHDAYQDKVAYNKDALTQVLKKEGGDGVGLQEVFHGGDRTTYQMKMKQFKGQKQKVGDDLQPVMGSLRGFLSSDFAKRDEFTLTFRTEQYREQLTQEDKFAKRGIELMASLGNGPSEEDLAVARESMRKDPPPLLFDLVFEKPELTKSARDSWTRVKRDTLNPTQLSRGRTWGTYKTTSLQHFQPPPDHDKPEFGRKPIIRDTFYRKTNIFFPKGATSEPRN